MIDRNLLRDTLSMYPAQPATAVWRAVEIGALLDVGIPEGRGLDLGCGDGKLTALMLQCAGTRRLVGVDLDTLEVRAAERSGLYEAVHDAPADCVPEADQSFDFVISNSVLEHVPTLEPVLHEVARLLRPGGRFLFTVPGPGFHANLRGSLLPWVPRERYLQDLDRRLTHLRYPTAEDWQLLCRDAGLCFDGCLGYLDRDKTQLWETLSRFTGGLLYASFGKRRAPIRIQRDLGLRQLQNRVRIPAVLSSAMTAVVCRGMSGTGARWLPEAAASCVLVHGTRP
ncbi:MAG TPA: class I SAM-dependent methyltransferase [Acidisphaera sp.]|nr:class I SAM-dependent methyltransferase [Acidisphaera sp.]